MENYELDPRRFLPAGHDIVDGRPFRVPRTFYTPAQAPPRHHEAYMVGIVEPVLPPEEVAMLCQQVLDFIADELELPVISAQTWFQGVGLYQMQDPVIRTALVNHAPWPLGVNQHGEEIFVRFINHDAGEGFRAIQGHRTS